MSAKEISMLKIKQLLRLHFEAKLTNRQIAGSLSLSVGVVNKYINKALSINLSWPLPPELDEQNLKKLLITSVSKEIQSAALDKIDFAKAHQELKLKSVTLQLLWKEYADQEEKPLSYSRYCHHYRVYKKSLKRSMRQTHKAGDKVFIDYSGVTVELIDPETNNIRAAQIFVGVLGASKFTFAEATWSQKLSDFLGSQRRMFEFFGGVPALVVPDNLRSAVSKCCKYEPDINPAYAQFIEHYETAVLPARPYRPQDKACAESGVQVVQRWILGRIRHQTFVGLAELNAQIMRLLTELNNKPFQKLPGCRASAFVELDKPALKALPDNAYDYRQYKSSRAGIDYHVPLNGHYYSIPHKYSGEKIDVWYTQHTVECYFKGKRIATHLYSSLSGKHSTITHHMPKGHQKQSEYSKERFIYWAKQVGIYTCFVIKQILKSKPHPELAYRSCLGVLNLAKKYGDERLEKACAYGVKQCAYSRKSILSIIDNNLDKTEFNQDETLNDSVFSCEHENIRGSDYYH
jgi:transposase